MNCPAEYQTSVQAIRERLNGARTLDDYVDIDPSLSNDLWWSLDTIEQLRLALLGIIHVIEYVAREDAKAVTDALERVEGNKP